MYSIFFMRTLKSFHNVCCYQIELEREILNTRDNHFSLLFIHDFKIFRAQSWLCGHINSPCHRYSDCFIEEKVLWHVIWIPKTSFIDNVFLSLSPFSLSPCVCAYNNHDQTCVIRGINGIGKKREHKKNTSTKKTQKNLYWKRRSGHVVIWMRLAKQIAERTHTQNSNVTQFRSFQSPSFSISLSFAFYRIYYNHSLTYHYYR